MKKHYFLFVCLWALLLLYPAYNGKSNNPIPIKQPTLLEIYNSLLTEQIKDIQTLRLQNDTLNQIYHANKN